MQDSNRYDIHHHHHPHLHHRHHNHHHGHQDHHFSKTVEKKNKKVSKMIPKRGPLFEHHFLNKQFVWSPNGDHNVEPKMEPQGGLHAYFFRNPDWTKLNFWKPIHHEPPPATSYQPPATRPQPPPPPPPQAISKQLRMWTRKETRKRQRREREKKRENKRQRKQTMKEKRKEKREIISRSIRKPTWKGIEINKQKRKE